jgi:hypothetical protein
MAKTYKAIISSDRFVCIDSGNYTFPRIGDLPIDHEYHAHMKNIHDAITRGDDLTLKDLLTYDMQCSPVSGEQGSYSGPFDCHHIPSVFFLTTRPLVEWLYFEDRKQFQKLVNSILNSNTMYKESLGKAFIDSFVNTDLAKSALTEFTPGMKLSIQNGINKLSTHAAKLLSGKTSQEIERGKLLNNLIADLNSKLHSFSNTNHSNTQNHTQKIYILNFKLEFVDAMHSKDQMQDNVTQGLNTHRDGGLSIIMSNLASLVFTGGLANIALGIVTRGHRWIFNQPTTSQSHIEALDDVVGLRL